jgi:DNA-binding MarR family transcriptional regulator
MDEAAKMANPKGAERLMAALRDVSAAEQRHGKAIARRLNMYATDFEALSFVVEHCVVTIGEVGRKLGLTSGAATGVIDRLAERGFVERVGDPRDRRKVVVRPVAARIRLSPTYLSPSRRHWLDWSPATLSSRSLLLRNFSRKLQSWWSHAQRSWSVGGPEPYQG